MLIFLICPVLLKSTSGLIYEFLYIEVRLTYILANSKKLFPEIIIILIIERGSNDRLVLIFRKD